MNNVDGAASILQHLGLRTGDRDQSSDLDATDADGLTDTACFTIKTQGDQRHRGDRRRHRRLDVHAGVPAGSVPDSFTVTMTDDGAATDQIVSVR